VVITSSVKTIIVVVPVIMIAIILVPVPGPPGAPPGRIIAPIKG
jgi:hypothetical protein